MAPLIISDLPVELLLDHILPLLPVQDLLNLTCASKFFAVLCNDETFWKQKTTADLNFTGAGTARTRGWKFLYERLSKPELYVWGESTHGRLGLTELPNTRIIGVPYPVRLQIPGHRIVGLVAGGMSFHALDSEGNVFVWGTLDGSVGSLPSDGFSESGKPANTPLRLQMPSMRAISCGRLHSAALDSQKQIWNFLSWGQPFKLTSPVFQDPDFQPAQVECGWSFTSFLSVSGDVFIWWPTGGHLGERVTERSQLLDQDNTNATQQTDDGEIPCKTWEIDHTPYKLRALPDLPPLHGYSGSEEQAPVKLVQIAALDCHIIGLTNYGHVLKHGSLMSEDAARNVRWEYLPKFSETEVLREEPAFADGQVQLTQDLRITHITAHYLNFIAYSTGDQSIVLMGDMDTGPNSHPKIIPELQSKSVISVILGDYHHGAVTSDGKLFTWGSFSKGALGLGDPYDLPPGVPGGFAPQRQGAGARRMRTPPAVEIPTEVLFDHKKKNRREKFCFAAAAAGWHTGALVVDLQPDDDEDEDEPVTNVAQSSNPPNPFPSDIPGQTPPFVPTLGIYRLGHAAGGSSSGAGPANVTR